MTYVTIVAQNGENFLAIPDPIFIVKVTDPVTPDRYIVTKAVWIYESSSDPELNDGWEVVRDLYNAEAANPANVLNAVTIDPAAIGGSEPVQTQPAKP